MPCPNPLTWPGSPTWNFLDLCQQYSSEIVPDPRSPIAAAGALLGLKFSSLPLRYPNAALPLELHWMQRRLCSLAAPMQIRFGLPDLFILSPDFLLNG